MLKLLSAALLLLATATANATLLKGIDGSFDVVGTANTTLNANGEVIEVDFDLIAAVVAIEGDYSNYLTGNSIFNVINPLLLNNVIGVELWTIEGFAFTGTSIRENSTNGAATGLYIIGDVTHDDFATTETEWFFSTQGLTLDAQSFSSFSFSVTSPAPQTVSEPGTLAILALGLIGFATNRKKKSA